MPAETPLTRRQRGALHLLARGGARYGTRHDAMAELRDLGLAYAHDKGGLREYPGRWTWRPTPAGRAAIAAMEPANAE